MEFEAIKVGLVAVLGCRGLLMGFPPSPVLEGATATGHHRPLYILIQSSEKRWSCQIIFDLGFGGREAPI